MRDDPSPRTRLHCRYCGDVIGVYEPLVVQCGSGDGESSLAAEPDLWGPGPECFHRQCYELLTSEAIGS
jgi:hypothetical protein